MHSCGCKLVPLWATGVYQQGHRVHRDAQQAAVAVAPRAAAADADAGGRRR